MNWKDMFASDLCAFFLTVLHLRSTGTIKGADMQILAERDVLHFIRIYTVQH